MVKAKQQIIDEIKAHIEKRGGSYPDWFVGTGPQARDRLFTSHKVLEKGDRWILRRAASAEVAGEVTNFFVSTLAADGQAKAADDASDAVYAYRKMPHTKP